MHIRKSLQASTLYLLDHRVTRPISGAFFFTYISAKDLWVEKGSKLLYVRVKALEDLLLLSLLHRKDYPL